VRIHQTVAIIALGTSILGLGLGCKRSAADRANDAATLIRSMNKEIVASEKTVVDKFKATPGSDDIKLSLGAQFDAWLVSDKALGATEDNLEQALISYQKDSKDEALIGELRLFTKKLAKEAQENGCVKFLL
jgi:hypothetical protein